VYTLFSHTHLTTLSQLLAVGGVTVLFVAELESLETRRNNQSRSFFQDICKPPSCLYHLIPPPRDTSVITRLRPTLPFLSPVYEPKSTVHLLTLAFTITNQKVTHKTISLCTSLPLHLCYVCYLFWFLLFLCIISLAFHLLFGPRAASLLLNWLIDWLIDWLIESGYDNVFNLTCVMSIPGETFQTSYVLTTNKTVEQ